MSDSFYHTNCDEGYVEEGKTILQQTPLEEKQMYLSEYDDRFVPRFTEEEIVTVIRGTRAEFRLQLKENKKGYGGAVRNMEQDLEQVLEEERMLAERDVAEKQGILDMTREMPPQEEMNDTDDSTYETLQEQYLELKSVLEYLRSYKDVTEECLMDIRELCEDFEHTVSALERRRNAVVDDFMETDSSCKKWVRKCREMAETVARAVERVESTLRQMEKKEKKAIEEEIRYTELLVQVENEMSNSNLKYDEISKSCKQEQIVMNAHFKRKKLELQDLDTKIAKAHQEHMELKGIADELMTEMNRTY